MLLLVIIKQELHGSVVPANNELRRYATFLEIMWYNLIKWLHHETCMPSGLRYVQFNWKQRGFTLLCYSLK